MEQQMPTTTHTSSSVHTVAAHAFRLEIGTGPPYRQDSDASDIMRERGEALGANKQENAENRGYVSETMVITLALEGVTYRATRETCTDR